LDGEREGHQQQDPRQRQQQEQQEQEQQQQQLTNLFGDSNLAHAGFF
jgi:hypothetical protein